MGQVILPKTENEIKEEKKEWRDERKVTELKFISEQTERLASRDSVSSIDIDSQTNRLTRSIDNVEIQLEGIKNYVVIIMLLLIAITINLYFH